MIIAPQPPNAAAFAPFGTFVEAAAMAGERQFYSDWVAPIPGFTPQFYVNHVAPSALPLALTLVERHPHAAQAFVPLDVERYLVTVLPARDTDGAPDPAGAVSFVVPGTMGIIYRRNAWHAGMTVLGRTGRFAVLMWRGADDDEVFAEIPTLTIAADGDTPVETAP